MKMEVVYDLLVENGPATARELAEVSYSRDSRCTFKTVYGDIYEGLHKLMEEGKVKRTETGMNNRAGAKYVWEVVQ